MCFFPPDALSFFRMAFKWGQVSTAMIWPLWSTLRLLGSSCYCSLELGMGRTTGNGDWREDRCAEGHVEMESPGVWPDGLSLFHEVWAKVMPNRSQSHASPSIPQFLPFSLCSSPSVPTHLLDKWSWGRKHWIHMCHGGQLRLEVCYRERFLPFLPSLFPFLSSLLLPPLTAYLPPSLSTFLLFLFSFFHSICLNTIIWKTLAGEKCQEVQMEIWYIWPFFSSEQ